MRETLEETGVAVRVGHVIGVYRLESGFTVSLFRCSIEDGEPRRPDTDEIAEVRWFPPDAMPAPVSNLLHHALADVTSDARGVVRDGLPRIN